MSLSDLFFTTISAVLGHYVCCRYVEQLAAEAAAEREAGIVNGEVQDWRSQFSNFVCRILTLRSAAIGHKST